MIDHCHDKLDQLMHLFQSMEHLNDLKPDGPLKAEKVRYPINTEVEFDPCPEMPAHRSYNDPMKQFYRTKNT
jgi:hypothetical protein